MTNDLIKQQIESARKAFVSTRSKQSLSTISFGDETDASSAQSLKRAEQQAEIMDRLSTLMMQASKTTRQHGMTANPPTSPAPATSSSTSSTTPFWAQTQTDIPPSERFEKAYAMQEPASPPPHAQVSEPNSDTHEPAPASTSPLSHTQAEHGEVGTALSAIRDEVISHMGDNAPSAHVDELISRLDMLEERVTKHQQDLTSLLKLIRQIAAKQNEQHEHPQPSQKRGSSVMMPLTFLVLACAGGAGWLYWINPTLLLNLMDKLINQSFIFVMQALALAGLV